MIKSISKVLIANRGEIAVRIIRTCRDLGVRTVAVYSEPDVISPHTLLADESVCIGPAASSESYLKMDTILDVAEQTGSDAIHPGYGFLSENAAFARKCQERGIIFIGPSADAIEAMGDKMQARAMMDQAGVPYPPGTREALKDVKEAGKFAEEIGFPVLVKAAAGGGGKGMRIIESPDGFEAGIKAAQSEARNAFGDERVYVEKYLESPRHVEFQILADNHGNYIHLFDRECSIQRRHQKVVEEAPCAILDDQFRDEMSKAAIAAAQSCDYTGAGTIEFMVDKHRNFYFLEMNTRLQVEHPITEKITGVDLVEWQLRIADDQPLNFKQQDLSRDGHAIECRICAEDPSDQFLPSTGRLERFKPVSGPGIRVDEGVRSHQQVTIDYDPLIAKLVTWGKDRNEAIRRMNRALEEFEISGVHTTIPFCRFVMEHEAFRQARYDTHFVKEHFTGEEVVNTASDYASVAAAALLKWNDNEQYRVKETKVVGSQNHTGAWWRNRVRQ